MINIRVCITQWNEKYTEGCHAMKWEINECVSPNEMRNKRVCVTPWNEENIRMWGHTMKMRKYTGMWHTWNDKYTEETFGHSRKIYGIDTKSDWKNKLLYIRNLKLIEGKWGDVSIYLIEGNWTMWVNMRGTDGKLGNKKIFQIRESRREMEYKCFQNWIEKSTDQINTKTFKPWNCFTRFYPHPVLPHPVLPHPVLPHPVLPPSCSTPTL